MHQPRHHQEVHAKALRCQMQQFMLGLFPYLYNRIFVSRHVIVCLPWLLTKLVTTVAQVYEQGERGLKITNPKHELTLHVV